ncbi:MAG TPA: hypothetical protein PKC40_11670, partial [Saprospiraceae bacterium]|nr:hypothetical protein [Saprospiraceae bacterium]
MKFFIPLLFAVFSLGVLNAQNSRNFWQEIPESQMRLAPDAQRDLTPLKYRTFTLELEDLKQYLASAPMEG